MIIIQKTILVLVHRVERLFFYFPNVNLANASSNLNVCVCIIAYRSEKHDQKHKLEKTEFNIRIANIFVCLFGSRSAVTASFLLLVFFDIILVFFIACTYVTIY